MKIRQTFLERMGCALARLSNDAVERQAMRFAAYRAELLSFVQYASADAYAYRRDQLRRLACVRG